MALGTKIENYINTLSPGQLLVRFISAIILLSITVTVFRFALFQLTAATVVFDINKNAEVRVFKTSETALGSEEEAVVIKSLEQGSHSLKLARGDYIFSLSESSATTSPDEIIDDDVQIKRSVATATLGWREKKSLDLSFKELLPVDQIASSLQIKNVALTTSKISYVKDGALETYDRESKKTSLGPRFSEDSSDFLGEYPSVVAFCSFSGSKGVAIINNNLFSITNGLASPILLDGIGDLVLDSTSFGDNALQCLGDAALYRNTVFIDNSYGTTELSIPNINGISNLTGTPNNLAWFEDENNADYSNQHVDVELTRGVEEEAIKEYNIYWYASGLNSPSKTVTVSNPIVSASIINNGTSLVYTTMDGVYQLEKNSNTPSRLFGNDLVGEDITKIDGYKNGFFFSTKTTLWYHSLNGNTSLVATDTNILVDSLEVNEALSTAMYTNRINSTTSRTPLDSLVLLTIGF